MCVYKPLYNKSPNWEMLHLKNYFKLHIFLFLLALRFIFIFYATSVFISPFHFSTCLLPKKKYYLMWNETIVPSAYFQSLFCPPFLLDQSTLKGLKLKTPKKSTITTIHHFYSVYLSKVLLLFSFSNSLELCCSSWRAS